MMQEISLTQKKIIQQKQQCDNQLKVATEAETLLNESSDDFVEFLDVRFSEFEKCAPLGNLTDKVFDLIKSDTGWLGDTIIHQVQVCLRQQNPNIKGFQRKTIGPVRNFNVVTSEFIQILHTGHSHWVCVSSIGCHGDHITLYDSLYNNIIATEVEGQVKALLGERECQMLVAPVQ